MRKTTRISLALGTSAALLSLSALPASAADVNPETPGVPADANAVATVMVPTGPLSITIESDSAAPVNFEFGTKDGKATIVVPTVTVTDSRATVDGWGVSVSMTDFTAVGGKTIEAAETVYSPGDVAQVGDAAVSVNKAPLVQTTKPGSAELSNAVSATAVGNNTASWTSTVSVPVPSNTLNGEYTATLTHSVL